MKEEKETWSREAGYVWSLIGSAVGFANVLSFSALCYKNGGGAFLIPYILAHLLVGIPMLLLESIIGQKTRLPFISAMGTSGFAKAKIFGWLSILSCATIGGFYIVLTGFSVAYTYFSSMGIIPANAAHFFKHDFLHTSSGISQMGGLSIGVLASTLIVALISWFVLVRNIRSGVEKICSLFLPMLGILMFVFTILACFLPGAIIGIRHYLVPDFARLNDWSLWRDVFGQVFFSLSLGLGIVTGYSRHNNSNFNLYRSMIKVALGDFIISFISGFAIFGCIGFMSQSSGIPFKDLLSSDSAFEIGFVIFPMILSYFGTVFSQIVGPLFFFCIFIAGITGVFSIVESVAGNIEIEFGKKRKTAVTIALALIFACAVPFCFGNGQHILGSLAPMLLGNAMLLGGIAEILFFLILSNAMKKEPLWMNKNNKLMYPYYLLKFFVFPLLCLSLLGAIYKEVVSPISLDVIVRWSWLACALGAAFFFSQKRLSLQNEVS